MKAYPASVVNVEDSFLVGSGDTLTDAKKWLLATTSGAGRYREDCIYDALWLVRMASHAVRVEECTGGVHPPPQPHILQRTQ
mmetsp:Transcript_24257/g.34976  ORF Transcript_24257/g.34976 Transcript_24257/m.34976 type:complete len:82 (-) Transcript_24257:1625-1870(-)